MGQRTGTRSTQVAIPSRNVPNTSNTRATIRQNIHGARFMATIASTSCPDIPENVNSHENAVEVAMMNKIMALLFPEARSIR